MKRKICMQETKWTNQALSNAFQKLKTLDWWRKSDFRVWNYQNVDEKMEKMEKNR